MALVFHIGSLARIGEEGVRTGGQPPEVNFSVQSTTRLNLPSIVRCFQIPRTTPGPAWLFGECRDKAFMGNADTDSPLPCAPACPKHRQMCKLWIVSKTVSTCKTQLDRSGGSYRQFRFIAMKWGILSVGVVFTPRLKRRHLLHFSTPDR